MLRRRTVAWLIAGLLASIQAGVASMNNEADESAEAASSAEQEIKVASAASEMAAPEPETEATSETTGSATPFAEIKGSAFPVSADEVEMLSLLHAYLERKAAARLTGAPGNVFPSSADDVRMLPSLAAYLDQLEATRFAAAANVAGDMQAAADRHAMLFARETHSSR